MKNRQGAVDVAPFSAIFIIVLRLLNHVLSNLALPAIEKVPDVSRLSAVFKGGILFILEFN